MSYKDHALAEFKAAGFTDEEGPNKWAQDNVLELLDVLSKQGHSGSSVHWVLGIFDKLARFEPLVPIQGTQDEWTEVVDGKMWQNKRCSHVFKDSADGPAYDSTGKVFREPNGSCFTSGDSRVFITFPYTPKTEYVDVGSPAQRTSEPT